MSRTWVQRTAAVAADDARRRLDPSITAATATLTVEGGWRAGPAGSWRCDGRWQAGRRTGDAAVEVSPLSRDVSQLDVGMTGASPGLAAAVADALRDQLEPPAPAAAPGRGARRDRRPVAAGAVVAVIAVVGVVAVQLLAPPAPVAVDDAIAAYRTQAGTAGAAPARSPTPPPRRAAADPARRDAMAAAPAVRGEGDGREREVSAVAAPVQSRSPRRAAAAPARREGARQQRHDPQPTHRRQVAPGVYSYDTSGYEEIDRPNGRHDYPSQTAITVQRTACGFDSRWQPFEHRWDEMSLCLRDGGALLERMATHREFYGQREHSEYRCDRGSVAWTARAGAEWRSRCSDGETTITSTGRTVALERMDVGGETVRALRFVMQGRLSGANEGTMRIERWVDAGSGLLLRLEGQTEVTAQTSVGPVRYREELSLRLRSTSPRT